MNSILQIFCRQTENLLQLTKTTVHAFRLQNLLVKDNLSLFESEAKHHCAFSHNLCEQLRSIQKRLHSTCFLLQRALYRAQALRQTRGEMFIQIKDEIIIAYRQSLSVELRHIQQLITSIIEETMLDDSPLHTLQALFRQIQENFVILLQNTHRMPRHKSTVYLGNLVSDTLERFYLVLGTLARIAMDIEENKTVG